MIWRRGGVEGKRGGGGINVRGNGGIERGEG